MAKHSERLMKIAGDIKVLPFRDLMALAALFKETTGYDLTAGEMAGDIIEVALAINPDEPLAVLSRTDAKGQVWR